MEGDGGEGESRPLITAHLFRHARLPLWTTQYPNILVIAELAPGRWGELDWFISKPPPPPIFHDLPLSSSTLPAILLPRIVRLILLDSRVNFRTVFLKISPSPLVLLGSPPLRLNATIHLTDAPLHLDCRLERAPHCVILASLNSHQRRDSASDRAACPPQQRPQCRSGRHLRQVICCIFLFFVFLSSCLSKLSDMGLLLNKTFCQHFKL